MKKFISLDEFCERLAGYGIPALIFLGAMSATGLTGAAAITAALALLGPGGIIGGLVFLGIISLGAQVITKYGYSTIMINVAKKIQQKENLTYAEICQRIDKFMVSKALKAKIKETIKQ